jgi:hypothetical protein
VENDMYYWEDLDNDETFFFHSIDSWREPECIGIGYRNSKYAWHFCLFDPKSYNTIYVQGDEQETTIKGFRSKTEMKRKITDAFA